MATNGPDAAGAGDAGQPTGGAEDAAADTAPSTASQKREGSQTAPSTESPQQAGSQATNTPQRKGSQTTVSSSPAHGRSSSESPPPFGSQSAPQSSLKGSRVGPRPTTPFSSSDSSSPVHFSSSSPTDSPSRGTSAGLGQPAAYFVPAHSTPESERSSRATVRSKSRAGSTRFSTRDRESTRFSTRDRESTRFSTQDRESTHPSMVRFHSSMRRGESMGSRAGQSIFQAPYSSLASSMSSTPFSAHFSGSVPFLPPDQGPMVRALSPENKDVKKIRLSFRQQVAQDGALKPPASAPAPAVHDAKFKELHRITSELWHEEKIPFQLYEMQKRPSHMLDVFIIRGKGITKGWFREIMNAPDPYLTLRIPGTPNGIKRTKEVNNKRDPQWAEHITFFVDPYGSPKLEVKLTDSKLLDMNMGVATLDLEHVTVNSGPQPRELGFLNNSRVFLTLEMKEMKQPPDVRAGQRLTKAEVTFATARRARVTQALQQLLAGDTAACPRNEQDAPTVAVLGSGGGLRATVGLSGALTALDRVGLLDCVQYLAGTSGSTWYMSYLYSQQRAGHYGPAQYERLLRQRICNGWRHLLMPKNLMRYVTSMARKSFNGQPVAFTDLFGFLIGDMLLGEEDSKAPLSAQRNQLKKGEMPMPLYAAIHVHRDISAIVFQEWITFTPYDVWLEKYGVSLKTELFGSKFHCGYAMREFPEPSIGFLMGLWGSAFSILFKRLVGDHKKVQYFVSSTAEAEQYINVELNRFRAMHEGYASGNDETGTSNESLVANSTDEAPSEEETEEQKKWREQMMEAVREHAEQRAKEEMEHRASRVSRHSRVSLKISASRRLRQSMLKNIPGLPEEPLTNIEDWIPKKRERRFRRVIQGRRTSRGESQRSFWRRMLDMVLSEGLWDSRQGRAGLVYNPLRGLVLRPIFPRELEKPITAKDTEPLKGMYAQSDPRFKRWFVVDAGLSMNLPFPAVLKPQRAVDLFIVFDFSSRPADDASPFQELLAAEHWAQKHGQRFPPIEVQVETYLREPPRECYLFEDEKDDVCPVVIFFPLINLSFQHFKEPGVPRVTLYEQKFGDFNIFSDASGTYSSLNLQLTPDAFDRLVGLMEYNVLNNEQMLKSVLRETVLRKRRLQPPPPPDEKLLLQQKAAALAEEARRRREKRKRERRRRRREAARRARESEREEDALLRRVKRRRQPWERARKRVVLAHRHYTQELAEHLAEAAATALDTDPSAPVTVLLGAAARSAAENARAQRLKWRRRHSRRLTSKSNMVRGSSSKLSGGEVLGPSKSAESQKSKSHVGPLKVSIAPTYSKLGVSLEESSKTEMITGALSEPDKLPKKSSLKPSWRRETPPFKVSVTVDNPTSPRKEKSEESQRENPAEKRTENPSQRFL